MTRLITDIARRSKALKGPARAFPFIRPMVWTKRTSPTAQELMAIVDAYCENSRWDYSTRPRYEGLSKIAVRMIEDNRIRNEQLTAAWKREILGKFNDIKRYETEMAQISSVADIMEKVRACETPAAASAELDDYYRKTNRKEQLERYIEDARDRIASLENGIEQLQDSTQHRGLLSDAKRRLRVTKDDLPPEFAYCGEDSEAVILAIKPRVIIYRHIGDALHQHDMGYFYVRIPHNYFDDTSSILYVHQAGHNYRGGAPHPHIQSGGVVCWGSASHSREEARNRDDLRTVLELLSGVIFTWGGHPYREWGSFTREKNRIARANGVPYAVYMAQGRTHEALPPKRALPDYEIEHRKELAKLRKIDAQKRKDLANAALAAITVRNTATGCPF